MCWYNFAIFQEAEFTVSSLEETLIEVNLILDILFLVFFDNFSICSGGVWITLCSIFKVSVFFPWPVQLNFYYFVTWCILSFHVCYPFRIFSVVLMMSGNLLYLLRQRIHFIMLKLSYFSFLLKLWTLKISFEWFVMKFLSGLVYLLILFSRMLVYLKTWQS